MSNQLAIYHPGKQVVRYAEPSGHFFVKRGRPYLAVELVLRNKFVEALATTGGDATAAAAKIGYSGASAKQIGCHFLAEPYVQQLMQDFVDAKVGGESLVRAQRAEVTDLLFLEARDRDPSLTSGSSRVAALNILTKVLGMIEEQQDASLNKGGHKGGVMVLPALQTPDEWEQNAAAQQRKLAQDA